MAVSIASASVPGGEFDQDYITHQPCWKRTSFPLEKRGSQLTCKERLRNLTYEKNSLDLLFQWSKFFLVKILEDFAVLSALNN